MVPNWNRYRPLLEDIGGALALAAIWILLLVLAGVLG